MRFRAEQGDGDEWLRRIFWFFFPPLFFLSFFFFWSLHITSFCHSSTHTYISVPFPIYISFSLFVLSSMVWNGIWGQSVDLDGKQGGFYAQA